MRRGRIVFSIRKRDQDTCVGLIHKVVMRGHKIRPFKSQNSSLGIGRLNDAIRGSKEVKMSVNIEPGREELV